MSYIPYPNADVLLKLCYLLIVTAPKRYTGIHDAARNGDVLELESMVKNGASINEVEESDKFTPLHSACNAGALEVS